MSDDIEVILQIKRQARQQALKEAAEIVDGCRMTGPSPIGPLHGCGWNEAQSLISKRIKEKLAEESE